jgi:NAD(P)-dependent dehydrogenase (short-subunit alcohol dehydrogenase family)
MNQNKNPFTLEKKKILVTGAASGIGRATSIILSKLGANLILVDINLDGLIQTQSDCDANDKIVVLDFTNPSSIKDKILSVIPEFGKLDGIVHLAGKPYLSPLKSINEQRCAEIYTINTFSAIELAKVFTNKNVFAGGLGSIVFVSSVYALVGTSANVGYAMSKSALHGITKSLAIELAPKKIRVNCVAPGFVNTKMMGTTQNMFADGREEILEQLHPLGLGDPEDVANTIAFLLTDASKWITGSIISVDGGFTAQ